jgi:hypothetical protein
LWILFPPSVTPPGVFVSSDESEVTSPISIAEWLRNFYPIAAKHPSCVRGICHAGEVMYIPSGASLASSYLTGIGWWHLVVNLSESIAVTQNFVPPAHLKSVLRFLRDKEDQISGFEEGSNVYNLFCEQLRTTCPDLLAATEEAMDKAKTKKKRKLIDITGDTYTFSFNLV